MPYLLGFVALVVIGALVFELHRIRTTFEAIYQLIVADRDAAREEVATMRTALFPQLNRLQPKQETKPVKTSIPVKQGISRIPWRIRIRQKMRDHNTTQLGRDKMAAAIPEAK